MSSKIIYERFLWFHNEIKQNRHPNAQTLATQFEITGKTAQRNIEFMRDRLNAPLRYVPHLRGYEYHDNTWEIPGFWLHEDEIISLVLSYRLASAVPDSSVKTALRTFLNQIIANHASANFSIDELSDKISVKNIAYAQTSENIFHGFLEALLRSRPMRIEYYSPHNGQTTTRDILPFHLLNYMGTWHIIAYCNVKKELRDFVLSRIKTISVCETPVDVHVPATRVKEYIRQTFGIFQGKETMEVCLRFAKDIASWIAEQSWHPAQKAWMEKDGRLSLTIPVADFREIKREILRYGSQVEVVTPAALRKEVKKEIEKMKKVYS
ncbi:MAG: WYL domain-containing protein [Deltaproteobacteria bacterium HGW-Deltaproteobacteria-6]|jgi:predicted DNA-binding transcriptional regulator YafY|nr:MAG: WYL domain-containing protein [Deltaproteobacteria bacterium HGW-Deltaproteobacteria-6]